MHIERVEVLGPLLEPTAHLEAIRPIIELPLGQGPIDREHRQEQRRQEHLPIVIPEADLVAEEVTVQDVVAVLGAAETMEVHEVAEA